MARYIDADAMLSKVKVNDDLVGKIDGKTLKAWIDSQQTVDVAPVTHAHWIIGGTHEYDEKSQNIMHCSNCKALFRYHGRKQNVNYCYKCGAKMDEPMRKQQK